MPLAHRDFSPAVVAHGRHPRWETLAQVVERANQWLALTGFRALSVETLVLPVPRNGAPTPAAGSVTARWDEDRTSVQIVRVWHEVPPPASAPFSPSPG